MKSSAGVGFWSLVFDLGSIFCIWFSNLEFGIFAFFSSISDFAFSTLPQKRDELAATAQ